MGKSTFNLNISFCMPQYTIIERTKSIGITATNKAEAINIEAVGADFIISQGIAAIGHRGIFDFKLVQELLMVDELL